MLTRCPASNCGIEFEFLPTEGQRTGLCPNCGQRASFRSVEVHRAIEREYRKRIADGSLSGGPQCFPEQPPKLMALLEDIRSLWNVGSIFRTADGAGIKQLYLTGITGSPPRKEIEKTSLGAEHYVSWQYCPNSLQVISELKKQGVLIVGMEYTEPSKNISSWSCQRDQLPICLIVGNEDAGISAQLLEQCDEVLHLPMRGVKISLNVAVAFGIAAYSIAEKVLEPIASKADYS